MMMMMMMMIVHSIHQRFDRHGHELHSMCCYQCELVCVDVRDPPLPPQHHRHYPARSVLHLNQSLSLMQMMVMTMIVVDVYPSPDRQTRKQQQRRREGKIQTEKAASLSSLSIRADTTEIPLTQQQTEAGDLFKSTRRSEVRSLPTLISEIAVE